VRQIEAVKRPLRDPTEGEYKELMCDLLWSDPTDNDNVQGLVSFLDLTFALDRYKATLVCVFTVDFYSYDHFIHGQRR
jgi:hypothetical protein